MVLAPTTAPQSGLPGTTRNARASALTLLDQEERHSLPGVPARRGGVSRGVRGTKGANCDVARIEGCSTISRSGFWVRVVGAARCSVGPRRGPCRGHTRALEPLIDAACEAP